jgi:hypothetical protein
VAESFAHGIRIDLITEKCIGCIMSWDTDGEEVLQECKRIRQVSVSKPSSSMLFTGR